MARAQQRSVVQRQAPQVHQATRASGASAVARQPTKPVKPCSIPCESPDCNGGANGCEGCQRGGWDRLVRTVPAGQPCTGCPPPLDEAQLYSSYASATGGAQPGQQRFDALPSETHPLLSPEMGAQGGQFAIAGLSLDEQFGQGGQARGQPLDEQFGQVLNGQIQGEFELTLGGDVAGTTTGQISGGGGGGIYDSGAGAYDNLTGQGVVQPDAEIPPGWEPCHDRDWENWEQYNNLSSERPY